MKEYIEREAVENIFWEEQQNLLKWKRYYQFDKDEKEDYDRLEDYRDKIKTLPTADVEPVIHGKWMPIITPFTTNRRVSRWRCSECREVVYNKQGNYCPKCGAKMVKCTEVINND